MFHKEEVQEILAQARHMDPGLEIPGVSEHQYKLKPPVDLAFVRAVEEEYHFRLPEDYVQFITEVGDGPRTRSYCRWSRTNWNISVLRKKTINRIPENTLGQEVIIRIMMFPMDFFTLAHTGAPAIMG